MVDRRPRPKSLAELKRIERERSSPHKPGGDGIKASVTTAHRANKPSAVVTANGEGVQADLRDTRRKKPRGSFFSFASIRSRRIAALSIGAVILAGVLIKELPVMPGPTIDVPDRASQGHGDNISPARDRWPPDAAMQLPIVELTEIRRVQITISDPRMQNLVDALALRCDSAWDVTAITVAWMGATARSEDEAAICAILSDRSHVDRAISRWMEITWVSRFFENEPFAAGFDLQARLQDVPDAQLYAAELRSWNLEQAVRGFYEEPMAGARQIADACDVPFQVANLAVAIRNIMQDPEDRTAICPDVQSEQLQALDRGMVNQVARREAYRFLLINNPDLIPRL